MDDLLVSGEYLNLIQFIAQTSLKPYVLCQKTSFNLYKRRFTDV